MFRTRDIYLKMCHQSKLLHVLTEEERFKLQAHLRQMYVDIERVCDKHGLTVMLAYGSLLGAVRHGGFIPWDDDLDLFMPREDYDKFIQLYSDELPSNYIVYAPHGRNGSIANFGKVVDKNTEFITPGDENMTHYRGVFVDIFPLEYIGTNRIINNAKRLLAMSLIYIAGSVGQYEAHSKLYRELMSGSSSAMFNYWFRQAIGFLFSFVKGSVWRNWIDDVCRGGEKTEYLHVPSGEYQWDPIEKKNYYPIIKIQFDDIQAYIPEHPSFLLNWTYGDWQRIPKKEERWEHFVVSFKLKLL